MSDLKPYSGVRCMCLVTGCSAGAGCPHYTDHCKAHIQHQNKQPAQAGQVLTEGEIVKCLVAAGCVGTVKMTYDSGPYEITRTSINADRFARAIEQAVLAKRVPQWLPIETAPKDGTEILLSNGETVAQGNWLHAEPYIREHRDIDGCYVDQDEFDGYDGWIDQTGGMQPDPTHWMPLPPPPGIVGEKGVA